MAWLGYLAHRVSDLPLLLLLGLRSGERRGERAELSRLVGGGGFRRLVLGPLGAAAVGEMVRSQLDEGAESRFCAAVSELSGGNPLFVRELLAAAREQGWSARDGRVEDLERIAPAAIGTSVLARLERLGAESVALARAVAILGAGSEVVLAARLADLDPTVAELTADRLAVAQILAPVRPLEFFHPLLGAAVLEDIAPGARRIAHRRAAALLEDLRQGSLARVAAHLLASGPAGDRWVVQRLNAAAREALDRGAPEIAASYARRALAEPPAERERAALLLSLGIAEWRAAQPDAIAHLEQALAVAGDDHRLLVRASGWLSQAYYVCDRTENAIEVLEQALAALGDSDSALAVRLDATIAITGMTNERTSPAAVRRAGELHDRLRTLTHPPVNLLVVAAWHALGVDRCAAEAEELAERALACEPYPPPRDLGTALLGGLLHLECYGRLQRLCDDLLESARRRGGIQDLAGISAWRAGASYDCGALADAEADARWVLEQGVGVYRMRALGELIRVLIERDELQEAQDAVDQVVDPRRSGSLEVPPFLFARAQLRSAQGRLEDALDDFLECGRRYERLKQLGEPPRGGPRRR